MTKYICFVSFPANTSVSLMETFNKLMLRPYAVAIPNTQEMLQVQWSAGPEVGSYYTMSPYAKTYMVQLIPHQIGYIKSELALTPEFGSGPELDGIKHSLQSVIGIESVGGPSSVPVAPIQ